MVHGSHQMRAVPLASYASNQPGSQKRSSIVCGRSLSFNDAPRCLMLRRNGCSNDRVTSMANGPPLPVTAVGRQVLGSRINSVTQSQNCGASRIYSGATRELYPVRI